MVFQRCREADFYDKPNGYVVTADDVAAELSRINYDLKPLISWL